MIIIRADANEHIGTGHVMRCLSVADAFTSIGEKVLFITADHRGDRLIDSRGYQSISLGTNWTSMDEEIPLLKAVVTEEQASLMLIDSYYVTLDYFRKLSEQVKIAYFDDLNAEKWDVNCLINYNVFSTSLDYSQYLVDNTQLLLGPSFAPLRNEFRGIPQHVTKEHMTDILVSAGGADPERITERLIENVCPKWPDVTFHFVVGSLNPRIEDIRNMAKGNVVLHINEQNMSGLMMLCDIAISAAGTTLYELCACGIPTITFTLADNQLLAAEHFEKQGIMLSAGDCRSVDGFEERISSMITCLADNKKIRKEYAHKMQALVDGNGAERLARELVGK